VARTVGVDGHGAGAQAPPFLPTTSFLPNPHPPIIQPNPPPPIHKIFLDIAVSLYS
jgi:hypothetical protein